MKSIFARHGILRVLVSDNATCYASRRFKMFADDFNFEHRTSSPGYPQSNGKAEKSVGIVKGVLNKALDSNDDIYLALLAHLCHHYYLRLYSIHLSLSLHFSQQKSCCVQHTLQASNLHHHVIAISMHLKNPYKNQLKL